MSEKISEAARGYKIVVNTDLNVLSKEIDEYVKKGYKLFEGLVMNEITPGVINYHQILIKGDILV